MFTYSKSRGLFAGVSLEGTVLIERVRLRHLWMVSAQGRRADARDEQKDANEAFYGQAIPAIDLLS